MKDSKIEWTDATFNPWHGCMKVSPGCTHCYAETLSKRWGRNIWGPAKTTERMGMSENYWRQPLKWNREALVSGVRKRVFCASMADVFEDHPQVEEWRWRLWDLIEETPNLDWLLLTKRPENVLANTARWARWSSQGKWPDNVWLGTSVENQEQADKRIFQLLAVPARVRFLSCEPLLGPIDLSDWFNCYWQEGVYDPITHRTGSLFVREPSDPAGIHWVIAGGESGPGARPMHPDWARSLRDQCQDAGVAFHFKQWGEYISYAHVGSIVLAEEGEGDLKWWKHEPIKLNGTQMVRVGKKEAGRELDGRTWDELPA